MKTTDKLTIKIVDSYNDVRDITLTINELEFILYLMKNSGYFNINNLWYNTKKNGELLKNDFIWVNYKG